MESTIDSTKVIISGQIFLFDVSVLEKKGGKIAQLTLLIMTYINQSFVKVSTRRKCFAR